MNALTEIHAPMQSIIRAAAKVYHLHPEDLTGPKVYFYLTQARRAAMVECRNQGYSFGQIAMRFNRSGPSVIAAIRDGVKPVCKEEKLSHCHAMFAPVENDRRIERDGRAGLHNTPSEAEKLIQARMRKIIGAFGSEPFCSKMVQPLFGLKIQPTADWLRAAEGKGHLVRLPKQPDHSARFGKGSVVYRVADKKHRKLA